jgi:hypothetical protein
MRGELHHLVDLLPEAELRPSLELIRDMPAAARPRRVYDDYLAEFADTEPEDLVVCDFSIFGPKNRVGLITIFPAGGASTALQAAAYAPVQPR